MTGAGVQKRKKKFSGTRKGDNKPRAQPESCGEASGSNQYQKGPFADENLSSES